VVVFHSSIVTFVIKHDLVMIDISITLLFKTFLHRKMLLFVAMDITGGGKGRKVMYHVFCEQTTVAYNMKVNVLLTQYYILQ